mgnify:CR=1 FL=1
MYTFRISCSTSFHEHVQTFHGDHGDFLPGVDKVAVGAVIHSNYLNGIVGVYGCNKVSYDEGHSMWDLGEGPAVNVAIINNVISPKGHYGYLFKYLDNSYIAYNTYCVLHFLIYISFLTYHYCTIYSCILH